MLIKNCDTVILQFVHKHELLTIMTKIVLSNKNNFYIFLRGTSTIKTFALQEHMIMAVNTTIRFSSNWSSATSLLVRIGMSDHPEGRGAISLQQLSSELWLVSLTDETYVHTCSNSLNVANIGVWMGLLVEKKTNKTVMSLDNRGWIPPTGLIGQITVNSWVVTVNSSYHLKDWGTAIKDSVNKTSYGDGYPSLKIEGVKEHPQEISLSLHSS